jgi:DNA repair protein RecO (recombination protein O)
LKQIDHGILIHKLTYSESSLILSFYTQQNGIQKFIFQGGKKKGTAIYPLSLLELTYYRRPDSELGKLTGVSASESIQHIPFHPVRSAIAFFIADVVRQCLKTEQDDEALYQFLKEKILELDTTEELALYPIFFLSDFSYHLGMFPNIPEEGGKFFILNEGEFTGYKPIGEIIVEGEVVDYLIKIFEGERSELSHTQLKKEAFEVLLNYYALHIPKFDTSSSLDILREVLY